MSDLFIKLRRPLAEQNIINNFVQSYQKGEDLYHSKEYHKALDEFRLALNFLNDIWDEYPKICTLYLIMKCLFHTRNFEECLSIQEEIKEKIKLEKRRDLNKNKNRNKKKNDMLIRIESKMDVYNLLIYFIYDNTKKSVECILKTIQYLSEENIMTLEEKILYFWIYLKGFIQLSGITKSIKFSEFKKNYNSMIIIEKGNNNPFNTSNIYNCMYEPILKLNPTIIDSYKSLMNVQLKNCLYEKLDREYYLFNFGIGNDKVIDFLQKNIHLYVYQKNKQKLLQLFTTFVVLGKIDLKKKFNMTMNELINVQRSRLEDFDIIFSNLIGGFNHIFRNYIHHEKNLDLTNNNIDKNKLKLRPKTGIRFNNIKVNKNLKNFYFNLNKPKEEITKDTKITSFNFFNIDNSDIKKLNNFEKINKVGFLSDFNRKKNKIIKLKNLSFRKNKLIDFQPKTNKLSSLTLNQNSENIQKYLSSRNSQKNSKISFPHIVNSEKFNNKKIKLSFSQGVMNIKNKMLKFRDNNIFNNVIEKLEKKNIKNNENKKKKDYYLRNINNIFMDILINLFTPIHKLENNLFIDEEKINYKKAFPRMIDLYKELQLKNIIKSYHYLWTPTMFSNESHNSFFYYENFLLIENLIFMGILRSYGNNGQSIATKLCILFPCFLIYIIIEDCLKQDKKDINKELFKLFKEEENSKDFKDMFLLKYFLYKFNINLKNTPLLLDNISLLKNQLNEAIYSSLKEIKTRYKLTPNISGTNLLSSFILYKTLYIFHLGYFEIAVGKYNPNFNEWELKFVIKQNEFDEESFTQIFHKKKINDKKKKENITNISNMETEKSNNSKSNNVNIFDEYKEIEFSKYTIEKNDKFIVLGSQGLFNNLTKDEISNIVGDFYINKKNADEACSHLVELAKNKSNKSLKEYILYYTLEKRNKNLGKEKERFLGYTNDISCVVIFLE